MATDGRTKFAQCILSTPPIRKLFISVLLKIVYLLLKACLGGRTIFQSLTPDSQAGSKERKCGPCREGNHKACSLPGCSCARNKHEGLK